LGREVKYSIVSVLIALLSFVALPLAAPDSSLPELAQPVNDFARVVDAASAAEIDRISRALQSVSGDVVVVATVPTIEPYADINEYAVKLFENHGRGLGVKGKDNGILILLAMKERRVKIEVGYGLEQWITDGYAGSTSREVMTPEFRAGRYGAGLLAGAEQVVARIAQARNISIQGIRAPRVTVHPTRTPVPVSVPFIIFIVLLVISRLGGGPGSRPRFWGGGGWSGWSSGVGPFGGGFGGRGGGFGGGGFGGGFGGFGGGGSGGGGGGSSW
jgi:uncharacterized protein